MDIIRKIKEMIDLQSRKDRLFKIKEVIDLQSRKDRAFIETQYANAENALRVLIEEEGCCNAMKPIIDALSEVKTTKAEGEENKYFVLSVLDIASGTVDVNLDETKKPDRLHKINEAIKFLTFLRRRYET